MMSGLLVRLTVVAVVLAAGATVWFVLGDAGEKGVVSSFGEGVADPARSVEPRVARARDLEEQRLIRLTVSDRRTGQVLSDSDLEFSALDGRSAGYERRTDGNGQVSVPVGSWVLSSGQSPAAFVAAEIEVTPETDVVQLECVGTIRIRLAGDGSRIDEVPGFVVPGSGTFSQVIESFDGSVQALDEIPSELQSAETPFEHAPVWAGALSTSLVADIQVPTFVGLHVVALHPGIHRVDPLHERWAGTVEAIGDDGAIAFSPSGQLLPRMPVSARLCVDPGMAVEVRVEMRPLVKITFLSDLVPEYDRVFAELSAFHRQGRVSSSNSIQKLVLDAGNDELVFDPVPVGDYLLQGFVSRGHDLWLFELAMSEQVESRRVRLSEVTGAWTLALRPGRPGVRADLVVFAPDGIHNELGIRPTWLARGTKGEVNLRGLTHSSGRIHVRWVTEGDPFDRESKFLDFDATRQGIYEY